MIPRTYAPNEEARFALRHLTCRENSLGDNATAQTGSRVIITALIDDQSRQAAISPDDYSLTIDDAVVRYEYAGHARTTHTIQRYCAKGHLDCLRQETPFGDKYLITPASVARHIAQIEELASATSRDRSRLVATDVAVKESQRDERQEAESSRDQPRPVATYVERIESENEFLRGQIGVKDN